MIYVYTYYLFNNCGYNLFLLCFYRFVTFACVKQIDRKDLTNFQKNNFFSSKYGNFTKGNRDNYLQYVNCIQKSIQGSYICFIVVVVSDFKILIVNIRAMLI